MVMVGSLTLLTRVAVTPPYDAMSFFVASDGGVIGVGGPSGQSFKVSGSAAVETVTTNENRRASRDVAGMSG